MSVLCQQIVIVCLVIVDALLVLGELLMDLKIIHPDKHHIAPKVKGKEEAMGAAISLSAGEPWRGASSLPCSQAGGKGFPALNLCSLFPGLSLPLPFHFNHLPG